MTFWEQVGWLFLGIFIPEAILALAFDSFDFKHMFAIAMAVGIANIVGGWEARYKAELE